MSDPKDIRFRKKGTLVVARIKVGKKWDDHSHGWHTRAEAREPAIALRDELQAKYATEHPNVEPSAEQTAQTGQEGCRERSLQELAEEQLDKYIDRQRLRAGDNLQSSLNWLWKNMGDKAKLPPKKQKKAYFTRIRNILIDGKLAQRTMELYSKTIREVLRQVPGLDPAFIAELENLPRKDDVTEASGDPFQQSHLKTMFDLIGTVAELVQILFWVGASGGPQIVDTVFLPFWAIDWVTGMISYRRIKTGERIEFCALPPLLELLKKRRERLGPNAIYVLPEIIFKKSELRDPECNQEGWHVIAKWKKVPKKIADRGAENGTKKMTAFLELCGIKTRALTHKSFRKHNISFWASIGIKLKTRMRMAGHSKENAHYRYDVPAAFEIIRAKEITWRYYQAHTS
jgi:hypothetical protein